jgi:uncharacterized protein (TIGR02466 family)
MIKNLFGLPVYHTSILNEKYNKKDILDVIEKNYNKNKNRNEWDKNNINASNFHHSYNDWKNNAFDIINYDSLIPIYEKNISNYLKGLNFNKNIKFNFTITNYTCMTEGQFMNGHMHSSCHFSAIHYLKFDENFNDTTLFFNSSSYSKFLDSFSPNFLNFFDPTDEKNNWLYPSFKFLTKEEDLIIFPSVLEHSVPAVKSDKYRITIAFNISLESL